MSKAEAGRNCGTAEAFAELYEQFMPRVFSYISYRVGDVHHVLGPNTVECFFIVTMDVCLSATDIGGYPRRAHWAISEEKFPDKPGRAKES